MEDVLARWVAMVYAADHSEAFGAAAPISIDRDSCEHVKRATMAAGAVGPAPGSEREK
jgi:hypothetical protein